VRAKLSTLLAQAIAAGKREGIEAAAKWLSEGWYLPTKYGPVPSGYAHLANEMQRALLQTEVAESGSGITSTVDHLTEARAETGEGKEGVCGEKMGSKPEWMSEWQYDPCSCKRMAGHDGPHACEHENAELLSDHEKGGGT
jgi:hypothetical protein